MTEFDDVLDELRQAAEAGTLVTVAWMVELDNGNHRFGHKGYPECRKLMTQTLNNLDTEPESKSLN